MGALAFSLHTQTILSRVSVLYFGALMDSSDKSRTCGVLSKLVGRRCH